MTLAALVVVAAAVGSASAAPVAPAPAAVSPAGHPASAAVAAPRHKRPPEERLRLLLANIRSKHEQEEREAIFGGAGDELRDAVASAKGPEKNLLEDRLPGMSADPFDLCRDLQSCPKAPLSLHVENQEMIDDAFAALARPWLNLQQARGKNVKITADPGQGVKLALEGLSQQPVVTLEASPAPTGGFDVSLAEGQQAADVYAAERAAVLPK